jgi:hypothetical protein
MKAIVAELLLILILAPAREEPGKGINLAMESNWGTVTQDGLKVSIDGDEAWSAKGTIRKDGKLFLLWLELGTGRTAPSVYTLKDGTITGLWGYALDCRVNDAGELVGDVSRDDIYDPTKGQP